MQVHNIQNNNYNTNFGTNLIISKQIYAAATTKQINELKALKKAFAHNGFMDELKVDKDGSVKDIIKRLYAKLEEYKSKPTASETYNRPGTGRFANYSA